MNIKKMLLTIGLVLGIFMTAGVASACQPGDHILLCGPTDGSSQVGPNHVLVFNENTAHNLKVVNTYTKLMNNETEYTWFDCEVTGYGCVYGEIDYVNYETGHSFKYMNAEPPMNPTC